MSSVAWFRAFGKLPYHADFLQVGPSSAPVARFDDWLTESVEWAHARTGQAWRDAFGSGGVRAFVYVAGAEGGHGSLIIGALAPSQDQAGRQFPISIATCLDLGADFSGEPALLPLACEDIWQDAGRYLAELGLTNEPLSRIADVPAPPLFDFAEAQYSYSAWSEALPLSELWALISASLSLESLRHTVRWITETVRPHRHREPPSTRLALRLPLGEAGGAAVCFWLDVVRRLIAWRKTVPSFFWSHEGSTGQLTVHLGAPATSSISELWLPSGSRDEFCDLTVLDPNAAASEHVLPLPAAIEQVLARPCSVAAFLATLGAE